MRYAVILTRTNDWDFESDDRQAATERFQEVMQSGQSCVLVKVLADSDEQSEIPNIFDD
jgi:hypothetical protein